ncbi:MAG: hypothetical protein NC081_02740 [Roseburia sp.]|nr:hypothetical protein [Roseburia sp.]
MKSFKKITATALTMAMIAASSMTAFAAPGDEDEEVTTPTETETETETEDDGTQTGSLGGTGTVEGVVNKDVFAVVLPTVAEGATTFDYVMDPQGLILTTNHAKYENATFAAGASVFFKNAKVEGATDDPYTATSDALTITNKSTLDVDVTLTATVTAVEGLTMAESATFAADDTAAKLYLALIGGEGETAQTKAITTEGTQITTKMNKAADGAYKVVYNSTDSEYVYDLTDEAKANDYTGFSTYSFKLTGACNTNTGVDWEDLKDANPAVEVVWTVADPTKAPKGVFESDGTNDIVVYYTGAKPSEVTLTPPATAVKKAAVNLTAGTNLTIDDEKITLKASYVATLKKSANYGAGTYKIAVNGKTTDVVIK